MDAPAEDALTDVADLTDSAEVTDVACGAATASECAQCGPPPGGQSLCHGCPYFDPPPECYAVCSAGQCQECLAGAWALVYYDCVKSPSDAGTPDADASATEIVDDVTTTGGQPGDLCDGSGQSTCATGLVCCYPCGIPGCQNKCAAPCSGPGCAGGCPIVP